MSNDKDNAANLVTGILLLSEVEREAAERGREADHLRNERDSAAREAEEAQAKVRKLQQQARVDYEDSLDDLEQQRHQFAHLLGLPLSEIAARTKGMNPAFHRNYEALMVDKGEFVVATKAYKELALRLADKLGVPHADVLAEYETLKLDVIAKKLPADHVANLVGGSEARAEAIKTRIHAAWEKVSADYKQWVNAGYFYHILPTAPSSWGIAVCQWKELARSGSSEARLNLAVDLQFGLYQYQDFVAAEAELTALESEGELKAAFHLYKLYTDPSNPGRNEEKAEHYLNRALAKGDPRADDALARRREQVARDEARRCEEELRQQFKAEQAGLLEQARIVREGAFPTELFELIKGRDYYWEPSMHALHKCALKFEVSHVRNHGTFFSPNRQGTLSLWVTNPGKEAVHLSFNKHKEQYSGKRSSLRGERCEAGKTTRLWLGHYPVGTTIETLELEVYHDVNYQKYEYAVYILPKPVIVR